MIKFQIRDSDRIDPFFRLFTSFFIYSVFFPSIDLTDNLRCC